MTEFDSIIIGSGQAAPFWQRALLAGAKPWPLSKATVLAESCVNTGCTPTKTLRKSARVAHLARRAAWISASQPARSR